MRLKLFTTTMAVLAATIFASEPADTANFDVIHGNSYSNISYTSELQFYRSAFIYALPSIAPTVNDLINMPHRMNGTNFAYFEPGNGFATASYTFNDKTTFLTMQNPGGGTGRATLGIATKGMGFSFTMEMYDHVELFEESSPYYKREVTTYTGSTWDSYQLLFSLPSKSLDLSTRFVFTRTNATDSLYSDIYKDADGKTEQTYLTHHYTLWGQLALANRPSANRFFWKGQADVLRYNHSIDHTLESTIDPDDEYDYTTNASANGFRFLLSYAFSYIALKSPKARVHVGAVSMLELYASDRMEDKENERKDFWQSGTITFYPGIWAEYAFNDNWMAWAASAFRWETSMQHEEYTEYWKEDDEAANTLYNFATKTSSPGVKTGVRFNYRWITLEASVLARFYTNPFRGFDKSNFLSNLSGQVSF